ncbi:MAG: menaquinol-cytochrome C reductase, partial [Verrucomicrobia bacterium]|nr:menaquinol-cytochrome C reductase [Verrucomicrobiota bacterium]
AVLATVLFLIIKTHGADLAAPADPSEPYSAARPEWYFMFLFQFLKYQNDLFGWLPGNPEIWAAMVIPGLLMGIVFTMPILGRWQLGHRFNIGMLWASLGGVALLTYLAYAQDRGDANYIVAAREAAQASERITVLAQAPSGIPPTGAVTLLRNDPLTQGPKLFSKNCASCHRFGGHDGLGNQPKDPASASDLKGFASHEWLAGLLDPQRIGTTNYFGATKHKDGKMAGFVNKKVGKYSVEQRENLKKGIAALSAEAQLKSQRAIDTRDASVINEGRALLTGDLSCTECHQFRKKDEDATAPDLTGYGSREWLTKIISNPTHESLYGKRNDRMPKFGDDEILDAHAIGLLADWLRGDWYEPAR